MFNKCKCGRNTNYGTTCTACRVTYVKTEKAESDEIEPGFHEETPLTDDLFETWDEVDD
jgi:hypothetical protein